MSHCELVYCCQILCCLLSMKSYIFLVLVAAVISACWGLDEAETNLEIRDVDAELKKRCHGEFKGALLEKRSLEDIAELSVLLKRCLIGGSRSGQLEKRDEIGLMY